MVTTKDNLTRLFLSYRLNLSSLPLSPPRPLPPPPFKLSMVPVPFILPPLKSYSFSKCRLRSRDGSHTCMKLQYGPLWQVPSSYWRHLASLKSVTGEYSHCNGLPA
mmetsp:Transcript_395/g.628  ORF Transcript_395/g.628 Transcript_395/m.628 type:complete len:106 (+) Transcript_395:587-904(+)